MLANLKKLAVNLNKTDFFITHNHPDHLGLVSSLVTDTSKVYFNRYESSPDNYQNFHQKAEQLYHSHGFPLDMLQRFQSEHPNRFLEMIKSLKFSIVEDNSTIEVNGYRLRCIATPGHSPGHICLYEANKKMLLSGDHVLADITSNITVWPNQANSLKIYLENLDKIRNLDVNIVLPGHGNTFKGLRERIDELKHHHAMRAEEILATLSNGDKHAFSISSLISWDVVEEQFEQLPDMQKFLATGETLSHLIYLEALGKVRRKNSNGMTVFSRKE